MFALFKKLFAPRKRQEEVREDYRVDPIIAVPNISSASPVAQQVREIVSSVKQMPVEIIPDNMELGEDGRTIGVLIAFQIGVPIVASAGSTTVGDIIRQCEDSLKTSTT
jgi:hypothetical protein